jgi:hypothetical protein
LPLVKVAKEEELRDTPMLVFFGFPCASSFLSLPNLTIAPPCFSSAPPCSRRVALPMSLSAIGRSFVPFLAAP